MEGPGNFYPPTVLDEIPEEATATREEIFGPVALSFRVSNAAAAIELANDNELGLGASAWTKDRAEQELFRERAGGGNGFSQRHGCF